MLIKIKKDDLLSSFFVQKNFINSIKFNVYEYNKYIKWFTKISQNPKFCKYTYKTSWLNLLKMLL